jgi:succinate dehydrogenase cytochrome b subunit
LQYDSTLRLRKRTAKAMNRAATHSGGKPPVYLDLLRIRLPAMALTSILHRFTGVLLALGIPAIIYLLGVSLSGPHGFQQVLALWGRAPVRVLAALALWAFSHHVLAGIRFLLLDLGLGVSLRPARMGAWAVNIGSLVFLAAAVGLLLP